MRIRMIDRLQNSNSIVVAGHRGYLSAYPENTLLGFQKAIDLGLEMVEFDLRLSKDKMLMVIHDDSVDRTTNGSGKVRDFTMKELKEFDASNDFQQYGKQEIPTFRELCELLKPFPDILLNVEIKPSADAKEAADEAIVMLKEYDYLTRCVFTSFDAEVIAHIYDTYGLKTQGFLGEVMQNFDPSENGTYSKMWAGALSMDLLTPERIEFFQKQGILAWCYCPDDGAQVQYALECGATLMTCNDPMPALSILKNKS